MRYKFVFDVPKELRTALVKVLVPAITQEDDCVVGIKETYILTLNGSRQLSESELEEVKVTTKRATAKQLGCPEEVVEVNYLRKG